MANGSAVQADTRFDIGSVTKTFTALGVLLLYQESQGTSRPLDLDAPISEYLHNTRSFKLPRKWSHITTRELLDMTSGINNMGSAQPWPAQIAAIAKERSSSRPGRNRFTATQTTTCSASSSSNGPGKTLATSSKIRF